MKKILIFLFLLFCGMELVGCDWDSEKSNPQTPSTTEPQTPSTLEQQKQFYTMLKKYADKETLTMKEETTIIDKDGNSLSATRTTDVDWNDKYTYSVIQCGQKKGSIIQKKLNYYYSFETDNDKLSFNNANDVYRTVGFSTLFSFKDFSFDGTKAYKNITGVDVSDFDVLMNNVNLDFNTHYAYNPSILPVSILFNENEIESITFDLSMVYGSYYKSVFRVVTFSFEPFAKKQIDDGEDKTFMVDTADTLDSYVIEMVYEYGDAIYIKSGDFDMLIDAGQYQDGANVRTMLNEYCTDKKLDVLIGTHGHADHLGGFGNGALSSIEEIALIIDFGYEDNNCLEYQQERNRFIGKGATYYSAYECVREQNGASRQYMFSEDLSLEVIDTNQYVPKGTVLTKQQSNAENDFSVVVKLTFKDTTYLYTGDLAGELQGLFTNALMEEDLKDITVYKAAHHGATSYQSNNTTLLNYLNPKICVSSAAIVNQDSPCDHSKNGETVYQHPRPGFVRWILNTPQIQKSKQYYFNGTMGTIHISDDGTANPTVTGLGAKRGYNDMNGNKVSGEANKKFVDTYMYQEYYLR